MNFGSAGCNYESGCDVRESASVALRFVAVQMLCSNGELNFKRYEINSYYTYSE